jgi:hypothetical protein
VCSQTRSYCPRLSLSSFTSSSFFLLLNNPDGPPGSPFVDGTLTSVSTVPEPATLALLGSALLERLRVRARRWSTCSVLGRLLDGVDHEHVDRPTGRLERQSQVLFERHGGREAGLG